jgi:GNAT superfamily N-acetyltransferase
LNDNGKNVFQSDSFAGWIQWIEYREPYQSEAKAYVLITGTPTPGIIILWFVYTIPQYRRKGYAKKLVKYLQSQASVIITGKGGSLREGNKLMRKCGFKSEGDSLVWRKEKKDGKESQDRSTKIGSQQAQKETEEGQVGD